MTEAQATVSRFNRLFDVQTQLQDDATQITATGNGTVGGSNKIIDVGAAQVSFSAVFDINTVDTTTGDELYLCHIQGSNSSSFANTIVNLCTLILGGASATGESAASTVGRYFQGGHNSKAGVVYRYLRARFVLSGTTPILDAECYLSVYTI